MIIVTYSISTFELYESRDRRDNGKDREKYIYMYICIYLIHFTLNTTPPPGRVSSPNRAAAVAIASSGEYKISVVWKKR